MALFLCIWGVTVKSTARVWEKNYMTKIVLSLTQVVAVKHAKRKTDKDNYPGLEDFNRFKNEPGSVDGYLQPRPLEALSYILDELRTTNNLAYQMMDRTGDGLALLVSNLCRAAAMQLPGETDVMSMGALIISVKPHQKQSSKWSAGITPIQAELSWYVITIISKSDEQIASSAPPKNHVQRSTDMHNQIAKEAHRVLQ